MVTVTAARSTGTWQETVARKKRTRYKNRKTWVLLTNRMAPSASSLVGHHQNLWPPPSPWSAQSAQDSSLHLPQAQLACAAQLASLPHTDLKTTSPSNRDWLCRRTRTGETSVSLSSAEALPAPSPVSFQNVVIILSKLCKFKHLHLC